MAIPLPFALAVAATVVFFAGLLDKPRAAEELKKLLDSLRLNKPEPEPEPEKPNPKPIFIPSPIETTEKCKDCEKCKRIYLHAFAGTTSAKRVLIAAEQELKKEKELLNYQAQFNGNKNFDPRLATGHVGISFDEQPEIIYGFNPNVSHSSNNEDSWRQTVETTIALRAREDPIRGAIWDDSSVFKKASAYQSEIVKVEYVYPQSVYESIKKEFDKQLKKIIIFINFLPARTKHPFPLRITLVSAVLFIIVPHGRSRC